MIVVHLALESDWLAAVEVGSYRVSTRGLSLDAVGFIHCATPAQVADVAGLFYADITAPLTLLELDTDRVTASGTEVRFEDAGSGESFPHLYGPIDTGWVHRVIPARMVGGRLTLLEASTTTLMDPPTPLPPEPWLDQD